MMTKMIISNREIIAMSNPRLIHLGARIKKIRIEKNLSQNKLAVLCGFEKANMSRLESGQSNPTVLKCYSFKKK